VIIYEKGCTEAALAVGLKIIAIGNSVKVRKLLHAGAFCHFYVKDKTIAFKWPPSQGNSCSMQLAK
jgi:hypothetical protein